MTDFHIIPSTDVEQFLTAMKEEVEPYLAKRGTSGYYETLPGQRLYYERYLSDNPRGLVVLLHGFTEGISKHRESAWQFLHAGYHVWMLQQREHGLSYRSTHDINLVNITDYRQLARDVHGFLKKVVLKDKEAEGLPRVLYGHSMGGGVSTICVECFPDDFQKVILSSPMLALTSEVPIPAAAAYGDIMLAAKRGVEAMPGNEPFDGKPDFEGSYSGSQGRYMYWFNQRLEHEENRMSMCSIATGRQFLSLTRHAVKPANCRLIRIPVLLLSAGEDTAVDNKGQDKFMQRISTDGHMVRFDGAKHELFMGDDALLEKYWSEILEFLDR